MSRDKIIDASVKVFSRVGYFQAGMQDIADEAGVAKGTLYYHFPSKSQLFLAVVSEGIDMTVSQLRKCVDAESSADKKIKDIVNVLVTLYADYPELASIFFNELSNGIDEKVLEEIKKLKNNFTEFLADILKEGYTYKIIKNVNSKMAAAALVGLLNGVCKYYIENSEKTKLDEARNLITDFITSGLMEG